MNRWRTPLSPLASVILLLTACAVPPKVQVLTFFFDGVGPASRPAVPTATRLGTEAAPRVPDLYLAARAEPPGFRHRPYADRECLACHESQVSQKLRREIPALCQSCHPAVAESRAYPHAPVAEGRCLTCHHPHESLEPALLLGSGWQLCAACHDEPRVAATPAHVQAGSRACQDCHDPHGGSTPHFLRQTPVARTGISAAPGSL